MIFFFSYIRKEKKFISLVCVQARKKKKENVDRWLMRAVDEKPKNPPPIRPMKVPESGTEKKIEIRG